MLQYAIARSWPGGPRSQQVDGLQRDRLALVRASGEEQQSRQCPQRVSLADPVPEPTANVDRRLLSIDRLFELRGQVALVGAALEQRRALAGRRAARVTQRSRVLCRGLPMCPGRGRPLRCQRRPAEHGLGVTRELGMMSEHRGVGLVARARRRGRTSARR